MYYSNWYGYAYTYKTKFAQDLWSSELALASLILGVAIYLVWRLARGMRLDRFERNVRTLSQVPGSRLQLTTRSAAPPRSGLAQISLLPLMLLSTGIAILVAQAQRPDDLSRPVTWGLFVVVGSLYCIHAWRHRRGVGPLRNCAMAGAVGAVAVSALLWAFYLAVDAVHADENASWRRMTGTTSTLIWWTALGGVIGAIIGAWRANRFYQKQLSVDSETVMDDDGRWTAVDTAPVPTGQAESVPSIQSVPRRKQRRRIGYGAIAMACVASAMFHVSAAPHIYNVLDIERLVWYRYDSTHYDWDASALHLTMASVDAGSPRPVSWGLPTVIAAKAPQPVVLNSVPLTQVPPNQSGLLANENATNVPDRLAKRRVLTVVQPIAKGERLIEAVRSMGNVAWVETYSAPVNPLPGDLVSGSFVVRDFEPGEVVTASDIARYDGRSPNEVPRVTGQLDPVDRALVDKIRDSTGNRLTETASRVSVSKRGARGQQPTDGVDGEDLTREIVAGHAILQGGPTGTLPGGPTGTLPQDNGNQVQDGAGVQINEPADLSEKSGLQIRQSAIEDLETLKSIVDRDGLDEIQVETKTPGPSSGATAGPLPPSVDSPSEGGPIGSGGGMGGIGSPITKARAKSSQPVIYTIPVPPNGPRVGPSGKGFTKGVQPVQPKISANPQPNANSLGTEDTLEDQLALDVQRLAPLVERFSGIPGVPAAPRFAVKIEGNSVTVRKATSGASSWMGGLERGDEVLSVAVTQSREKVVAVKDTAGDEVLVTVTPTRKKLDAMKNPAKTAALLENLYNSPIADFQVTIRRNGKVMTLVVSR